jgi:uncharacterized protein (TIGR02172 family)
MSDQTQNIKTKFDGTILTIYLEGNLDKTNSPTLVKEIFTAIGSHPKALPKLDFEELKDISNEGLHLLKKIKDTIGIKLIIQNVSNEIYDILNNTGFTEIHNVQKKLRSVNIEGLEKIGDGGMAKVYKLDEGKVIKVFKPNISFDLMIQKEKAVATTAYISGVPTPIAYETVKVGDYYGIIFEYLEAKDLVVVMENDREHIEDYIKEFVKTIKKVHKIKINPEKSVSIKQKNIEILPLLEGEGKLLNKEEMEKIKKILETIPDTNTFIHGDFHPGNIMYKNGEMIFIDLSTSGYGHPIFDMSSMYIIYKIFASDPEQKKNIQSARGFSAEEIKNIYNIFLKEYLETEDKNLIEKADKQIQGIACTRLLFSDIAVPGLIPREALNNFKRTAIQYYDSGLEPICF